LWRRPRPKLGCGAKERRKKKKKKKNQCSSHTLCFLASILRKTLNLQIDIRNYLPAPENLELYGIHLNIDCMKCPRICVYWCAKTMPDKAGVMKRDRFSLYKMLLLVWIQNI
jgi:hypothetical protein